MNKCEALPHTSIAETAALPATRPFSRQLLGERPSACAVLWALWYARELTHFLLPDMTFGPPQAFFTYLQII